MSRFTYPKTSSHPVAADQLIDRVQQLARARGERMTDVRRDILTVMVKLGKPCGAYPILEVLNKKRASKLSPMSLYRTLDFLIALGVVIKLESQNAYQLCAERDHDHSHLLMICDSCGVMREVDDHAAVKKLRLLARENGHILQHRAIELHGACSHCVAA